jgi:hypothetical protein
MRTLHLAAALVVVAVPAAAGPAGPAWKRLGAARATASSYLQSNWNKYDENYHPNYVLDDNPKTAWVEGVDGNGERQSITIPLSDLQSARALRLDVFNGYQKSKALLTANAAPRDVVVTVRDAAGDVVATQPATLQRKMGAQRVVIPIPPQRGVASVSVAIASVHPGRAYKDTCISDIDVFVDSDVAYNAAVEQQKIAAAKAWIKERTTTARAFAARPKTYPFASTHFTAGNGGSFSDEDIVDYDHGAVAIAGRSALGDQLAAGKGEGIVAKVFSDDDLRAFAGLDTDVGSGNWRLDRKDATPAPDGLEELAAWVDLDVVAALAVPGATFFESSGDNATTVRDGDYRSFTRSRFKVAFDPADKKRPRAVAFHEHERVEERESYTSDRDYVFSFDDKGLLVSVRAKSVEAENGAVSIARIDVERDDQGRVQALSVKAATGGRGAKGGLANTTWVARYTAQQPAA